MLNRTVLTLIAVCLLSLNPRAQETHQLHAERTVDFTLRKVNDLKAQVGQVRIASGELTDMGRGFGQGGQSHVLPGRHNPKALCDKRAVEALQARDVRDGAERDQIKQVNDLGLGQRFE